MNNIQKNILIAIGAVIAAMLIFPPYHLVMGGGKVLGRGYSFILNPQPNATINISQLLIQWVGVIILGSILIVVNNNKTNVTKSNANSNIFHAAYIKLKSKSSNKLGLKWYYFYTYINLPLNAFNTYYFDHIYKQKLIEYGYSNEYINKLNLFPQFYYDLVYIYTLILVLLIIGMHMKDEYAYKINWIVIIITTLSPPPVPLSNMDMNASVNLDLNTYISLLTIKIIFYFIPSYFYWKKRKHLFTNRLT